MAASRAWITWSDNEPGQADCVWLSFRHRDQRYRFSLNGYGRWRDDESFSEVVAVLRPEGDDPRRFLPAGVGWTKSPLTGAGRWC